MSGVRLGVVGATGEVGREALKILYERKFPYQELRLFASERSAGARVEVAGRPYTVERLSESSFAGLDLALFAAGADVSRRFAPIAAAAGCRVVDKSSAFREDPDIPLVVPEVNPEDLRLIEKRGIVSSPNCATTPLVMALAPLDRRYRALRVVVSTYQSVSGAGRKGIEELEREISLPPGEREAAKRTFSRAIAFNCVPHIDAFLPDGTTKEEQKTVRESQKILHRPDLRVSATTVRVPVWRGHALSVNVQFERRPDLSEVRRILAKTPGVAVMDDPAKQLFPTSLDAEGADGTLVGRLREDLSVEWGLNMWLVVDNLRKGAAQNAVQIAESLSARL
ncbi:MAG: aspartate-semialdehyde dehydrogenase [Myxococcales bacterium]|nr:aspartate-semialdehyde dehydrogenase [Myxococcales bacterium]